MRPYAHVSSINALVIHRGVGLIPPTHAVPRSSDSPALNFSLVIHDETTNPKVDLAIAAMLELINASAKSEYGTDSEFGKLGVDLECSSTVLKTFSCFVSGCAHLPGLNLDADRLTIDGRKAVASVPSSGQTFR